VNRKKTLIIIAIIGLLASAYTAVLRHAIELRNMAVEVVVDYEEAAQLAGYAGKDPSEVLAAFKSAGATSCAVSALNIRDAVDEGLLVRSGPSKFIATESFAGETKKWLDAELPTLRDGLTIKPVGAGKVELTIKLPWSYAQQLPIGLGPAAEDAREAGMELIARIPNYRGASPQSVDALLRMVKEAGSSKVIFDGEQVLGFKGCEKEAGEAFVKNGMYFGYVEFSKQKGAEKLASAAQSNIVVVHSITQAEMPNLSAVTIQDRFQKAVRERGVRVCYVRLYETAGTDMLQANVNYISGITKAINKAGYEMKSAHPIDDLVVPIWARILSGAAVAAGIMLLVLSILQLPANIFSVVEILVFVVCLVGSAAGATGRSFIALFGALSYPTLAALWCVSGVRAVSSRAHLTRVLGLLAGAVLISACGGLLVVGLLSERMFMLRLDTFMGVKAAHFLPVAVLAVLYGGGIGWGPAVWEVQKNTLIKRIREVSSNPILVWQAAGFVAVLILLALMVARSGNDSGLEVSSFEIRFRSILDKILYVRPRTKEFLIGYPALLCGIAFALRGYKNWAIPCIVLGCFGLVSALNTFCHIHTPIALSLLRVFNGLWVGALVGLLAYRVVRYLPGKD
jgi:hypothetical protein